MNEEDMILPDDFQEETPSLETEVETQTETEETFDTEAEDTKPAEEEKVLTESEKLEAFKLRLKYNHEEMEVDEDKARELAQKGLNYEKAIERAAQEAEQRGRDAAISALKMEWQGKPILTEADYKQAIAEKELLDKYQDLPPELVEELLENRKDRKEREAERAKLEASQKRERMVNEFIEAYPNVEISSIKPETWEKVDKGEMSLKHAYMEQEVADLRMKLKIQEQNQRNQQRAPVTAVSTHGTGDNASDPFLEGFDSIK